MFTARGRRKICTLSLFLACLSAAALAQSVPASSPQKLSLTLRQAVLLALKQNPQQLIAQLQVQQSGRESQIARAPLLPQADLYATAGLSQYNFQSVERLPAPKPAGPYQYFEGGTDFSQTLLNLPAIRRYQIGREGVVEARANEKTSRENVTALVVTQYLLVLRAMANYEATSARVALAQRLYNQAVELQKTGIGLNIDVLRANVELQTERQALIRADTDTRTTRYRLAELLDLPRDQEPEAADHLEFFDVPSFDRAIILDKALVSRPEMKTIASEQRIAQLTQKSASEQRLPQLDFDGYWAPQGVHVNDTIPAYSYAATLRFPLFVGGRIHAEVQRDKLVRQEVDESRKQLEARIIQEVKSAADELDAARTAVEVANLALKLANDEVAQAERRFQAGVTTNIEVITAQTSLAQANDNQIEALYNFNQSRANLARAMGEIENTYAK
jgi:outer membrane protein TolC